jgi:hypothetical protein
MIHCTRRVTVCLLPHSLVIGEDCLLGHNKWICGSECAKHRSHTYIHTYISQDQASPCCTQLEILDLLLLELDPLNIHLFFFLIFHQLKGCFPPDRQKSPRIYSIKKLFFNKRVRICKFSRAARTA